MSNLPYPVSLPLAPLVAALGRISMLLEISSISILHTPPCQLRRRTRAFSGNLAGMGGRSHQQISPYHVH